MKEPSPDKEVVFEQVHAESGEPLPPQLVVDMAEAESLRMIEAMLNSQPPLAYREPLMREGKVIGYAIKEYANPQNSRPNKEDKVLRLEDLNAQRNIDEMNEARNVLVQDIEDTKDAQSNH